MVYFNYCTIRWLLLIRRFDYGTGILLPFIGKTDVERRQMINALGPVWDGNEVWMITAGGCIIRILPSCICYIV